MSAFYPPDDNHSHLVARRSGSLNGFIRFAPLYIALMGIFFTPTVFAGANRWDCDYWSAEENAIDCGYNNNNGISVGKTSVALGHSNKASGKNSFAVGYSNTASGQNSSAVGISNTASGYLSSAMGDYNIASDSYSSAFGYQSRALSANSHAFGGQNNYSGKGVSNVTMGTGSVALGYQNNYKATDAVTVGEESSAVGVKNTASGQYSSALGYGNTASGSFSSAVGRDNTAEGPQYSSAMGNYNTASGNFSSAVGYGNTATTNFSSALGYNNNASGAYSSALGYNNTASKIYSSALGNQNEAVGQYSTALGYQNTASGEYSTALGNQNMASGNYATAIGFKSVANARGTTAIGSQSYADSRTRAQLTGYSPAGTNNSSDTTGVWKATTPELAVGDPENKGSNGIITRQITGVAAGYKDTDAVNVAQLKELQANEKCSYDAKGNLLCGKDNSVTTNTKNATVLGTANNKSVSGSLMDNAVVVGYQNDYSMINSTAVGVENNAKGAASSVLGYQNNASGGGSSALGYQNTASGDSSSAMGRENIASGAYYSSAMGYKNIASGRNSSAVGSLNNATNNNVQVFGSRNNYSADNSTVTVGETSVAVGYLNNYKNAGEVTVGENSSALGVKNTASAKYSSAVGYNNTASGNYSSVFGANSQAIVDYGTAIGYQSYANTLDLKSLDGTGLYAPTDFDSLDDKGKAVWQSTSAALAVGDPNGDGNGGTPITRQITGVAAGSQDTDAVNVAQLKEVADLASSDSFSPFTVSGTTGNFKVGSSGSLKMVGSNANISTKANGDTVTIALANDLNLTSVNTGGVQMSATGLAMSNQKITGLANGTANTDAVNLGQLNTSINTAAAAATTALNTAKSELEGKITAAETNAKGYTDTALGSYAKTSDLAPYAKTADLAAYAKTSDLAPYAKTADVTSQINNAKTAATTALNNAKTDLQGKIDTANSEIGTLKTDKADKSWVTAEIAKVNSGGSVDLSDYATKTYAESQANNAKTNAVTDANAYTDSKVSGLAKASDLAPYAKTSDMNTAIDTAKSGAITDANAYTDSKVGGLAKTSDLDKKADKSWVTTELAKVSSGGSIDLSDYATKTYAESQANAAQTNANAYTDSKLGGYAKTTDLGAYAKSADVASQINAAANTATTQLNNAKTELQGKIDTAQNTAVSNANAYTDSKLGGLPTTADLDKKADKTWVTNEIARVNSGGSIDLSGYATETYAETQANQAQTAANAYTDSKLGGLAKQADLTAVQGEVGSLKTDLGNKADKTALDGKADKSWVTTELAKVSSGGAIDLSDYAQKDYADNAANTAETNAKGYTDSEMAKAKSYADTAASQAKTDAVADANAYTDTALSDNATQTWVNNQKFAKEQAVSDLNSRVDKLVVAGGGYEHITVAGENGSFNVANKETAKFVGDGKNITTDATGGEVKISLADNIAVNSVNAGGTVVNQNGVTLPSGVALTNSGLNNGGQVISNVAPGVRPTDAVNVSQLNNAMGGVYGRIDSMEKHANAGIAQAMASGNMPTIAKPGKGMLAVSGSAYRGESGYAIGYSQMSESGKWLFKATGSGNSRGHYGISAGVGLELW